jgi:enoyl-CoA hydratase/carnithine racemase
VGVITISRETYNYDVDAELNRAVDWLKAEGIGSVILTGDFHLSTQMAGADTSEFFPALSDVEEGRRVAAAWSATARRFHNEFKVSVGFAGGKRCLGGFLELLNHCHYLVAVENTTLGMPEVTLPVLPGMEGCHWPFRKAKPAHWPRLARMLLTGKPVKAKDAVDWLIDYAGPIEDSLKTVWSLASGSAAGLTKRKLEEGPLKGIPADVAVSVSDSHGTEAARHAIMHSVRSSCGVPLSEALDLQAKHSADFTVTSFCREGAIGTEHERTMMV